MGRVSKQAVGATCVYAALMLSAGCAHVSPQVAGGGVPRDSLETYIAKVRRLSIAAAPKRPAIASVEDREGELHDALRQLTYGATAARHVRVADAYRAAGILDKAYDHYVAARDLDGRDAAAYVGLARVWRDLGAPELGVGDASRALYYAPRSSVAYNTLGTLLGALGQRKEARHAFERAVAIDPDAAYAWTNLCYQSFQAGEFGAAAASCERALAADPGFAPAHNNLALVHAAAGDLPRAEADFASAGDRAAQQFNMGIVLSAARKYSDAAGAFETAARLRPGWALASERAQQSRRLARVQTGAASSTR